MEGVKELQEAGKAIELLNYLLPGLLVAWLVHALTDYERPSAFEQIVHALVALAFVQAVVVILRAAALFFGRYFTLGEWTATSDFVASIAIAVVLGLTIARLSQSTNFFQRLERRGWRLHRADTPVWLDSFYASYQTASARDDTSLEPREKPGRWATLVLADERRIRGWPRRFPADGLTGHVALTRAAWLVAGGDPPVIPIVGVQEVLIPVADIKRVEFLEEYVNESRVDTSPRESSGAPDSTAAPATPTSAGTVPATGA